MMKISNLIKRLEEAKEYAKGQDLQVVVGERNSLLIDKIDVNVDTKGKLDNESWENQVCIIQAYHCF